MTQTLSAVPLATPTLGASGSLITNGKATWLLSCGHILTGTRHGSRNWETWRPQLSAFALNGEALSLQMFKSGEPLFRWAPDGVTSVNVEDAIALPLSAAQVKFLKGYQVFSIADLRKPSMHEPVMFFGYPGFGASYPKVPQQSQIATHVNGFGHQMMALATPSKDGFSGGPVVSKAGLVGVVSGNLGLGDNRAMAVVLSEISTELFR